jgi:predicted NBD/HSP70 family sugar kinase
MGVGIGDLINIFNPDVVVLGGLFNRLNPLAADSQRAGIESRVLDAPGGMATVVPAALGADAAVIGAAEMALSRVLADPGRRPRRAAADGAGAHQTTPPARSVP